MSYKKYEEFGGPGGTIYILKILSKFKGENLVLGKFGGAGDGPHKLLCGSAYAWLHAYT